MIFSGQRSVALFKERFQQEMEASAADETVYFEPAV